MTVSSVSTTATTPTASSTASSAMQTLGQADFIKLMTTEMQQQDPTAPVDNKEMIAQMAQFSQVSGITDINTNLQAIGSKLDAILAAQTAAQSAASTAATAATGTTSPSTSTSTGTTA